MVGMARENLLSAVELFYQKKAHNHMGPGGSTEGDFMVNQGRKGLWESFRISNKKA